MMRHIMGALVTNKDLQVLVIDEPPYVRLSLAVNAWVKLSPEEARHVAGALSQSADRVEKQDEPEPPGAA